MTSESSNSVLVEGGGVKFVRDHRIDIAPRICVGKYLAEASVWIAMVTMLAVLNIDKARDEKGREIDITPEFTPGVIM